MQESDSLHNIESFWEYSDPAVSEERFRAAMVSAQGDLRLDLLTQIARTFSLRGRFDEAHEVLNEVERHGYVFEEIAENLAALGRHDEATPYFGRAFDEPLEKIV